MMESRPNKCMLDNGGKRKISRPGAAAQRFCGQSFYACVAPLRELFILERAMTLQEVTEETEN
ncbi:MAG: hypothetical protein ACI8T1_004851 [Verrucomicrobiales bacterium]|jgi:hypothetical protein